MPFDLVIARTNGSPLNLTLNLGDILFVLGANGSGKSALMQRFYAAHHRLARRLSAHRQTWFESNASTLSPDRKQYAEITLQSTDVNNDARWRDHHSSVRPSLAIQGLIDAENARARSIASAVDDRNIDLANTRSEKGAPIEIIDELLRQSSLHITISLSEDELIIATKFGGATYSIAELSDGERNVLLIAASVLTAKTGTLVLIDEPDRHLHRSIISPLLTLLFAKRPDCAFVVSTHEVMLPMDNRNARTLLVRGCTFYDELSPPYPPLDSGIGPSAGSPVAGWDADLVPPETEIDDEIKTDILGSRRKVLFIEGRDSSLDKPLYSLLFPNVSVIAKSSCRDVEHAVSGIRAAANLHWLHAFGIVDNDGRGQTDIDTLKAKGVYAVSVFSVESIYYHPEIQRRVVERHVGVTGEDAHERLDGARVAAVAVILPHVQRLSERAVEKKLREEIIRHLPTRQDIAAGTPINVSVDVRAAVTEDQRRLQETLDAGNLSAVIERYPVRETAALKEIANKLGFQSREQYEGTVRKLLMGRQ